MPLNYRDYHPKWKLISRLIRFKRAGNCCEKCTVQNHALILRTKRAWRYASADELKSLQHLRGLGWNNIRAMRYLKLTKVILTVAHLDRDRHNNRFWNLKALCQGCHLGHDMVQHVRNRKYGRHHDREHQLQLFNAYNDATQNREDPDRPGADDARANNQTHGEAPGHHLVVPVYSSLSVS